MKSTIEEMYGLARTPNPTSHRPIQGSGYPDFARVMTLCSQMHDWQKNIKYRLSANKDAYVAASPGAGKTLPYICYWMEHILGVTATGLQEPRYLQQNITIANNLLNHSEQVGKLVVLVPIRSLAQQTTYEFQVLFSQMLASFLHTLMQGIFVNEGINLLGDPQGGLRVVNVPPGGQRRSLLDYPDCVQLVSAINDKLPDQLRLRDQMYNDFTQSQKRNDINTSTVLSQRLEGIDTGIRELMMSGIRRVVETNRSKYGLVATRTGLSHEGDPKHAPVTIAIYESASSFINSIAGKIKLLVLDESHLIQNKSTKDNQDARSYNIAYALYSVLGTLKSNNDYRLLFLSGTANPSSAQNLAKYIDMCYGRNIDKVIEPPGTAGNPSSVSITPDDSVYDERTLLKILKTGQAGTVIVIFSKFKIDQLITKAISGTSPQSLQSVQGGVYQAQKFKPLLQGVPKYGGSASKTTQFDPNKLGRQAVSHNMDAAKIHDPLLRQAVQAGFGYIYRLEDEAKHFKERKDDNAIVADLFSSGKIKVLLSTDAIGIGVNIKVKTLIIPSVEKPTGGGRREQMDPATLAQLLHRAGRGAFQYANIVCPQQDVAAISHALSLSPSGFTGGATIQKFPIGACRMTRFFADLYGAL